MLIAALLAYALPAALITMLPGPDTAMVLTTAYRGGRAAAIRAAWGVGSGILVWGAAAALGVAAALRASSTVYEVFRWSCITYLLVLAIQALLTARRERGEPVAGEDHGPATAAATLGWGYRRALLTCLFNPKLGVLFVVFLPQFVPSGAPAAEVSFALAALQAAEAILWYLLLGRVASRATQILSRQRVRRWLDRLSASVFVAFATRILVEPRA